MQSPEPKTSSKTRPPEPADSFPLAPRAHYKQGAKSSRTGTSLIFKSSVKNRLEIKETQHQPEPSHGENARRQSVIPTLPPIMDRLPDRIISRQNFLNTNNRSQESLEKPVKIPPMSKLPPPHEKKRQAWSGDQPPKPPRRLSESPNFLEPTSVTPQLQREREEDKNEEAAGGGGGILLGGVVMKHTFEKFKGGGGGDGAEEIMEGFGKQRETALQRYKRDKHRQLERKKLERMLLRGKAASSTSSSIYASSQHRPPPAPTELSSNLEPLAAPSRSLAFGTEHPRSKKSFLKSNLGHLSQNSNNSSSQMLQLNSLTNTNETMPAISHPLVKSQGGALTRASCELSYFNKPPRPEDKRAFTPNSPLSQHIFHKTERHISGTSNLKFRESRDPSKEDTAKLSLLSMRTTLDPPLSSPALSAQEWWSLYISGESPPSRLVRWDIFEEAIVSFVEQNIFAAKRAPRVQWKAFLFAFKNTFALHPSEYREWNEEPIPPSRGTIKPYKGVVTSIDRWLEFVQQGDGSNTVRSALEKALSQSTVLSKREEGKTRSYGVYRYACGSWYKGEYRRHLRQGRGYLNLCTGDVYEGNFEKGRRNGQGTLKNANGGIYKGEWLNDQREGFGTQHWGDDSVYNGTWKKGKQNIGTYVWANGDQYSGQWKGWQMEGQGTLKLVASGEVLKGTFKNSKLHGRNCQKVMPNGSYYRGDWVEGQMRGRGIILNNLKSGSQLYSGQVQNSEPHGRGRKQSKRQGKPWEVRLYEGCFENGKELGQASIQYFNGAKYKGELKDLTRHGNGELEIYKYKETIILSGAWKAGRLEGEGSFKNKTLGIVYIGKFRSNCFHGHGVLKTAEYQYSGLFNEGKKHGSGILQTGGGQKIEGVFEMDSISGRSFPTYRVQDLI